MQKFTFLLYLSLVFSLVSCSNELVHTWNIDNYEIIRENGKESSYRNIGTLTFDKEGTGHFNYQIIENDFIDKSKFTWEKKEGYILIKPASNSSESKLTKAWIITEDKAKKQIWKSTDGDYKIQILELSRN